MTPAYRMTVCVSTYKRTCHFASSLTSATLAFISDHQVRAVKHGNTFASAEMHIGRRF